MSDAAGGIDRSEGDVNLGPARDAFRSRLDGTTRGLLDRDARAFLHQSLSTPCLNVLQSAKGSRIVDAAGRSLLDFHGNSVHQIGHGHPRVIEAVTRQMERLPFCPRRYTNEPAILLAERLGGLTGGRLSKVLLAPGGAAAMGIAMKLARLATGRGKFLSMWGAFHGASLDTISIGGEAIFRRGVGPLLPGCEHVLPCVPSACGADRGAGCGLACARSVEQVLAYEPDIAAVIAEPVRCTTVDVPPADYWRRVRDACDRAGALLVFDEIPICLGRTGRTFAFEHFGVAPDIVVLGKGLGGGIIPQAAVLARPELDVGREVALGHYTHEKSPVGAAAALATLDVLRDEGLIDRAAASGEAWMVRLRRVLADSPFLRSVRGLGLLVGVEVGVGPGGRPTHEFTDGVLYAALERGLNFKVSDGRVLTLTPPLNATDAELDAAGAILAESMVSAGWA